MLRNVLGVFTLSIFLFACGKGDKKITNPSTIAYKDSAGTAAFRRTTGITAADGAVSIPLTNGQSLWLFGDSYIDGFDAATGTVPCLFQVRNAGLVQQQNGLSTAGKTLLGTGSIKSYLQVGSDNNYWFWPGCGYQQGDTAYVFLERIHATGGSGGFGFENVDSQYVAKIKVPEMTVVGYTNLGPQNDIHWVHGAVEEGNFRYVYGTKNNGFGEDMFVARYPKANIYGAWEYYNGSTFTTNKAGLAKIHSEFTSSFHISKVAGKYVLLTTEFSVDCNQGKEIYSYVASKPEGPFTNKKTVWTLDDALQGNYPFFYLAYAHPEYDNGKNELMVSYCINGYGTCIPSCNNGRLNPDFYRPRVIRVPYSVLGL